MNDLPAAAAGTITLGGDLGVRRMALGAMQIMRGGPEAARALLRRAVDLGINLIDTADVYGAGASERLIAEALHPYPDGLVVATKGGQVRVPPEPARPDGSPEHLRSACEGSLRRLRMDRIDLYQLHVRDPNVPLEDSLGALVELRAEGKIHHIGVSNVFGDHLKTALSTVSVVSVQNRYNLCDRRSEPELRDCERLGIAFLPWFPLGSGSLASAGGELARLAAKLGATPAQVALSWLLARSPATIPIPGTSSLEHLEENVRATHLTLDAQEIARLEKGACSPRA